MNLESASPGLRPEPIKRISVRSTGSDIGFTEKSQKVNRFRPRSEFFMTDFFSITYTERDVAHRRAL